MFENEFEERIKKESDELFINSNDDKENKEKR